MSMDDSDDDDSFNINYFCQYCVKKRNRYSQWHRSFGGLAHLDPFPANFIPDNDRIICASVYRDVCPWDKRTWKKCKNPNCIVALPNTQTPDCCTSCREKFTCKRCGDPTWNCPQEHIAIKYCTDCRVFYNCVKCGKRQNDLYPRAMCKECESHAAAMICLSCKRECRLGSLVYPWKKIHVQYCLDCTPFGAIREPRMQFAWLLLPRRGSYLLTRVNNILMRLPTEVTLEDAVRLTLMCDWDLQRDWLIRNCIESPIPRNYRDHNVDLFIISIRHHEANKKARAGMLKRYICHARYARGRLLEQYNCDYIFIFYLRWLPQDIIMRILDYVGE